MWYWYILWTENCVNALLPLGDKRSPKQSHTFYQNDKDSYKHLILAWSDPIEAGDCHGEGGDLVEVQVECQIRGQVFPEQEKDQDKF